jgi:Short C-terminal domain
MTTMISRWIFGLLFASCASSAVLADEHGFISYIPQGATIERVLKVLEQAFSNRQWQLVKTDENSVKASLLHRSYDCQLIISLVNNALVYDDNCTISEMSGGANRRMPLPTRETNIPDMWIRSLRSDVSRMLATIPDAKPSNDNLIIPSTVSERLKTLEELRNSGLITDQEFAQKRQEILKSL